MRLPDIFAPALRSSLRDGYSRRDLRADLLAGITVGIVAVPLAMALAIASGVPPQHGLYTAAVAGGVIALLGGSRFNVSGPTAAFVVILQPITVQHGIGGLFLATLLAGVLLVILGGAGLGRLITFIPYPVTVGFTAGIAVVIASLQVRDFLGLELAHQSDRFIEQVTLLAEALPTFHWPDLIIGAVTLAVLIVWPRLNRAIPRHLVGIAIGGVLAALLSRLVPGFHAETIADRFTYTIDGAAGSGIPAVAPHFVLPWTFPGKDGLPLEVSWGLLQDLLGPAMTIAVLGSIESLLCAVIADGMSGTKHDPNAELVAQGLGNIVSPFFGGIAATGALARTATSIRAGARSPIAGATHAVFVFLSIVALAPLLGSLPLASLAALLLMVAWHMSEAKHFLHIVRKAPRPDIAVLLACFTLTVVFDMVTAVTAGVVFAALLFMGRMTSIAGARWVESGSGELAGTPLPPDVRVYEIAGPLFFGAAEKAISMLRRYDAGVRTVVLDVGAVPVIDMTGLVALESTLGLLRSKGVRVVLAGLQPQPAKALRRAGIEPRSGELDLAPSLRQALAGLGAPAEAPSAVAAV